MMHFTPQKIISISKLTLLLFPAIVFAHPCTNPYGFAQNMALVRATGMSYAQYVNAEGKAPDSLTERIEKSIFLAPFNPKLPMDKAMDDIVKIIERQCKK